jgi:HK97 family phage portal protein
MEDFVSSKRAGKVMALEAGLSFSPTQVNPDDAQLLDTRRFQVEDVCRWFGTPPIIIGHAASGQTMWGSGVEAIMLAWLTLGINPQLRRFEARIKKDLIPLDRRAKWSVEWNREAMLQMDSKSKAVFLTGLTNSGIMSADESRDRLDLARRGGAADDLHAQTALAPLEALGKDKKE